MRSIFKRYWQLFLITGGVVVADQLSKLWVGNHGIILNTGMSFSFLSSFPQAIWIVAITLFLVLIWCLAPQFWLKHPIMTGLFFGGAISNLIDRLFFHGVRDWLFVPLLNVHNNLADLAISASVVLILSHEIIQMQRSDQK